MAQMHTNLMGAAGLQADINPCKAGTDGLGDLIMGHGPLAALLDHGLAQAVFGVPPDRRTDGPLHNIGQPVHKCVIDPIDTVNAELTGQMAMRGISFGGHHHPADLLIEPVNDARTHHAANPRQACTAMMQQCIDQRATRMAGGWMHDHAGRLNHDDDRLVFVENIKRDGFSRHRAGPDFRQIQVELFTGFDRMGRLTYHPVPVGNRTILDERCEP